MGTFTLQMQNPAAADVARAGLSCESSNGSAAYASGLGNSSAGTAVAMVKTVTTRVIAAWAAITRKPIFVPTLHDRWPLNPT